LFRPSPLFRRVTFISRGSALLKSCARCHPERYSAKDLAPLVEERRCFGVPQHDICAGFMQSPLDREEPLPLAVMIIRLAGSVNGFRRPRESLRLHGLAARATAPGQ